MQSASSVSLRLNQRLELLDRSGARTVPASNTVAIRVEHITQRFKVIHERPDTLRELFAKFFRHTASYYSFEAVRDVSFEVPKGQTIAILGRNGSGKSTLLKIIAGVYKPTSECVEVDGTIAPPN